MSRLATLSTGCQRCKITSKESNFAKYLSLSPSPLPPMTMVSTAATLLTKLLTLVLVPPVLQVLSRVFQELILLLSLKQRAHNSHSLDLHLIFSNPSSCRGFCSSLRFETDLCFRLSLLISDKGNVPTILVNVHTAVLLQHLFDILSCNFTTKSSQLEN